MRIALEDSLSSAIIKMAEGNPGAISALMNLIEASERIDPQNGLGKIAPLFSLDIYGIYGTDIYVLYNDKCSRSSRKTILLLRATQFGFFSSCKLAEIATEQGGVLPDDEWELLDSLVCAELDQFVKI